MNSFLRSSILSSDVSNVDEILALPCMQDEENLHKLHIICSNSIGKYVEFNSNSELFMMELNKLYDMTACVYEPRSPSPTQMDQSEQMEETDSESESEAILLSPLSNLFEFMKSGGIRDVEYLFTRSWFCHDLSLQQKVFKLVMQNRGHLLYTVSGDFEEHLDSILL